MKHKCNCNQHTIESDTAEPNNVNVCSCGRNKSEQGKTNFGLNILDENNFDSNSTGCACGGNCGCNE